MPLFSDSLGDVVVGMTLSADRLFQRAAHVGPDVGGTAGPDRHSGLGNITFADLRDGPDFLQSHGHIGLMDMGPGNDFAVANSAGIVRLGQGEDTFSAQGDVSFVSGGSGSDTINLAGGGIADGGAGNDTILAQGQFAASGGSGQDTFKLFLDASETGAPRHDPNIIDGGAGFDTLEIIVSGGRDAGPSGVMALGTGTADGPGALDPNLAAQAARAVAEGAGTLHAFVLNLASIEQITIVADGVRYVF